MGDQAARMLTPGAAKSGYLKKKKKVPLNEKK
jgi:hypothetical protein